nr:MAG TPA: hypothetical protein [Caudoviricetes sp.]DAH46255.1 MAG TPA: hypothetical protein [Caudoviricetes sp.]
MLHEQVHLYKYVLYAIQSASFAEICLHFCFSQV